MTVLQTKSDKCDLMCLPWQQERGSHTESRGDSHNIGHHNVGDEDQHQGEGHNPLDRDKQL